MMSMIIIGALIVLGIGLAAKLFLDKKESPYRITLAEYAIAGGVMLALVIPGTTWLGYKMAFDNAVTYEEYWGGQEVQAEWKKIKCERDGAAAHTFRCDPYKVRVSYDCSYYTGSGKDRRRVSKTCYRWETRYHSCPYVTEEWTFLVHTTLGTFTIAANNFPNNPENYRYTSPKGYSRPAPEDVPRGIPAFWTEAKNRLDANKPGPVTVRKEYDNLILASQHTILKKYSQDIERYKKEGAFPTISSQVRDFYLADRVYFVGLNPDSRWQWHINYFNGALGYELQGDLHLVLVDADKVSDPDNYAAALAAYWQSPELQPNALSKNAILVVLGVKGDKVEWSRATTGMPRGNEAMLIEIRDQLKGAPFDPRSILGVPQGELVNDGGKTKVRIVHGPDQGALESIIFGANKFQRVRMTDYQYLAHEIEPSDGQKGWIYFFIVLFGVIAWGICIKVGTPAMRSRRETFGK